MKRNNHLHVAVGKITDKENCGLQQWMYCPTLPLNYIQKRWHCLPAGKCEDEHRNGLGGSILIHSTLREMSMFIRHYFRGHRKWLFQSPYKMDERKVTALIATYCPFPAHDVSGTAEFLYCSLLSALSASGYLKKKKTSTDYKSNTDSKRKKERTNELANERSSI